MVEMKHSMIFNSNENSPEWVRLQVVCDINTLCFIFKMQRWNMVGIRMAASFDDQPECMCAVTYLSIYIFVVSYEPSRWL